MRRAITWLKDISGKVIGWKQSAAVVDYINEMTTWIGKFHTARDLMNDDLDAISDMKWDLKKIERKTLRIHRYTQSKIEKQFTSVGSPAPLAMLFAKIFVGEPSHVDGDPSKCQAFSFDTSGPDCTKLGAQVAGYMKDNAQLTKKAQNLASKQRGLLLSLARQG